MNELQKTFVVVVMAAVLMTLFLIMVSHNSDFVLASLIGDGSSTARFDPRYFESSLQHSSKIASSLCNSWSQKLVLFIPVTPTVNEFNMLKFVLLPSLALFWPAENLNVLFITNGEDPMVGEFSQELLLMSDNAGIPSSQAKVSISYSFVEESIGKIAQKVGNRNQWLSFWADNFTQAPYVGFAHSDTTFITPVLNSDLFVDDRPIVRPIFGKPRLQDRGPGIIEATFKAIGMNVPFDCMTYFPVVIKTKHLRPIREHIRKQFNTTTFDEAFATYIMPEEYYSQYSMVCAYLWYFERGEYYWTVRNREPGPWRPPYPLAAETNREAMGLDDEYFERYMPSLALHWMHESIRNKAFQKCLRDIAKMSQEDKRYCTKENGLQKAWRRGVCYSPMLREDAVLPRMCRELEIWNTPNTAEWSFEDQVFMHDRNATLAAHQKRLSLLKQCPKTQDRNVLLTHFWEEALELE